MPKEHNGSIAYEGAAGTCWNNQEDSQRRHRDPGPDLAHFRWLSGYSPSSPSSLRPPGCPSVMSPQGCLREKPAQCHVNLDPNEAGASFLNN